jgi:ribosomal protein L25 (general stress protein Ctc)
MKTTILMIVLMASWTLSFSQDQKGLARVNRIDGIEVYFMNEPLNDYEVVFDVGTGLKATSLITGGLINEGVSEKASQFVKKAIKEAKDEKYDFDAIIYSSGKKIIAVKFKNPKADLKLLARVQKIEGVEVYLLSEPLKEYEVLNSKKGGFKMKSALTAGLVNNSIEEDVAQFVQKLVKDSEKDNEKIDAIVYGAGKSAAGIKFIK